MDETLGQAASIERNQYIVDGVLQMRLLMEKFSKTGYLLSFNFNKNKVTGIKDIVCDGKQIMEVVV